jgi:hypothetical protein
LDNAASKFSDIPPAHLVSLRPRQYLKQRYWFAHCGVFTAKAVLSAYGRDAKDRVEDYHTNTVARTMGTFVGRNYYPGILRAHGLKAEGCNADKMADHEKLTLLKKLLLTGHPVVLNVGNGHDSRGTFRVMKSRLLSHWISLWGYDDAEQSFWAYDSLVPQTSQSPISVGNQKRPYEELLLAWKGAVLTRMMLGRYYYIRINGVEP